MSKNVVITGSTRGIGLGMADAFLARGCKVIINGRTQEGIDRALSELKEKYPESHTSGIICDVRVPDEVASLWRETSTILGEVDIWINNAGYSPPQGPVANVSPPDAAAAIETNLLGVIYGCQVAIQGMLKQGGGSIYIMEGMGADGRKHAGLTLYGTTKYGLRYLIDGLIEEMRGSSVIVGSIRPGMVITNFITRQFEDKPEEFEQAKRIFNIIADRVETVTPWLVDRVLENNHHGVRITYTSNIKLFWRFLSAPFVRRDLFEGLEKDI